MPDFLTLQAGYPRDRDYPERTFRLASLSRVLDGTLYAALEHSFGDEKTDGGEYIPLAKRRPSARTRICCTVVNDSVSMLFSEGHFPAVECADETTRDALTKLAKETNLNLVMVEAATIGSVGSVAVLMRVLKGRVFFSAMATGYMTPTWDPEAPDTLLSVIERYKVKGKVLKATGYAIPDDKLDTDFWFQRVWDGQAETWYLPQGKEEATKGEPPVVDTARTVKHALGFVPVVWVRNLPGGDDIDGAATFPPEAVDVQIEADYLLSQGGRGLKYQSDPTLHIKEPALGSAPGGIVKGAANAIITSEKGDAKLLEISGDAAAAVLDWVKGLREIALEGAGGNRANADKLSAAQSGRAMELMHTSLINLSDKLRISYGEGALLALFTMVVEAAKKFELVDKKGRKLAPFNADDDLSLRWPKWFASTPQDRVDMAAALKSHIDSGTMSRLTAVKTIAEEYDIEDVDAEMLLIDAQRKTDAALLTASNQNKSAMDL